MNIYILTSIFLSVLLFYTPVFGSGSVEITEIMYDVSGTDTGREWIEIYNNGTTPVDVSTWKLFEAQVNHKLIPYTDASIPAQGYAVIVDNVDTFKSDNFTYSGIIFDSAFSLSNEGEALVLRDGDAKDIDSVLYDPSLGGGGDGSSIHKNNDTWVGGRATLGGPYEGPFLETAVPHGSSATSTASDDTTEPDETSENTKDIDKGISSHASQSPLSTRTVVTEFQVSAGRSRIGFVGVPISFKTKVLKSKNMSSGSLSSQWSLGDGGFKNGESISHVYQFPGDYIVILNAKWGDEDAVAKTKIKIVEPEVDVEQVSRNVIRVWNKASYELNLGGWIIESERNRYVLPSDTILAGKGSIYISLDTIGLGYVREFIRLVNPIGTVYKNIPFHNDIQIIIPDSLIKK